jgi:hypothetical protein
MTIIDGGGEFGPVVRMDGGDDLRERDALATDRRVGPEAAGKALVDREPVGR